MANNNNNREYISAYPPSASGGMYTFRKREWYGESNKEYPDNTYCDYARNVNLDDLPYYLTPKPSPARIRGGYTDPISIHAFDGFYIVVYKDGGAVKLDYVEGNTTRTAVLSETAQADEPIRSIVRFNVYDTPEDPLSGEFVKKLIIYPDKKSMDLDPEGDIVLADIDVDINQTPDLIHAVVHQSRVFGIDNDRIYASGFNDYTNWNLDTADESLASNAWVTTSQSNTKADSDFTAITVYDGTVIAFKKGFMHEITNNKNPFRVVDVYNEGANDSRSIWEVDGKLLFVSSHGVMQYTGGKPRKISANIDFDYPESKGIAGGFGENYFVYSEQRKELLSYNVNNQQWSTVDIIGTPICFSSNSENLYMLTEDGSIYTINTESVSDTVTAEVSLSPFAFGSLSNKQLRKISILADMASGTNITVVLRKSDGTEIEMINTTAYSDGDRVINMMPNMTAGFQHTFILRLKGNIKLKIMEVRYQYADERYT